MPAYLYLSENGDVFNAAATILGVYTLFYLAYNEWLSLKKQEEITCLKWAAGATFIAGMIYFLIENPFFPDLKNIMIQQVASLTHGFLRLLGFNVELQGVTLINTENTNPMTKYVSIIFSCTAIQAIALFAGMIGALYRADIKRKTIALLVTIIPIYILNVVRTSSVAVSYTHLTLPTN